MGLRWWVIQVSESVCIEEQDPDEDDLAEQEVDACEGELVDINPNKWC